MKVRIIRTMATWVILLALIGFATAAQAAADKTANWTLETVDGNTVTFHDQLAKGPVVVSFWATWCKPCIKEMPALNTIAGDFAGQISILAVNADNSKSVAKVAPMISAKHWDNLIVPLDTSGELQQLLQVGGTIPFLILYDGKGREIYRHIGYKPGDEVELRHEIENLLANVAVGTEVDTGKPAWGEAVSATDKFKYSYSSDTKKEIFENWLDVSYQFGGFRTGVMLRSYAPSEEGLRGTNIEHRFFEFDSGEFGIRAGHFYGMFGRGLVFNSYEDRIVRVDTRLDGLIASTRQDRFTVTAFSGTPSVQDLDIRGIDGEYELGMKFRLGASGLTYRPDDYVSDDGEVRREWVASGRARQQFSFGDYYVEYGRRKGWEYGPDDGYDMGYAFYGNLNLYQGPFSVSWENSDYKRFKIVSDADGKTPLNRPPSLAREFTWTLLNRAPHNLDADDEKGNNLDILFSSGDWSLLASGAHLKNQEGETRYELAFGSFKKENLGPTTITGGFGYQDSEGLRQTVVGEITLYTSSTTNWTLQAEHQHVRMGGGTGFDLGAYDQDWFKLEYSTAPRWAFAAIYEINNKDDIQRPSTEKEGPFPAGQITYTISQGGNLNLWFGKRQAGYLCSGGVCKIEPAFEGVELFGLFRY